MAAGKCNVPGTPVDGVELWGGGGSNYQVQVTRVDSEGALVGRHRRWVG